MTPWERKLEDQIIATKSAAEVAYIVTQSLISEQQAFLRTLNGSVATGVLEERIDAAEFAVHALKGMIAELHQLFDAPDEAKQQTQEL